MQDSDCFLVFEANIDRFMKGLKKGLWRAAGLHFRQLSTPQNLVSFSVWDGDIAVQLRFVVIALGHNQALGRLSWLDKKGLDHVCCFVNDDFQCVAPVANGVWRAQKQRVGEVCLRRLQELKAGLL
ncbi:hypothetical protein [Marinomonas pollencensis]|uniref:Uncharacterized protein n=1 Tax=Marinomonas pollencensis TaxID=491954 RepID=A0A3E0DJS3_9GAMM|nr:hypothetical protein [Marinomonas pollencensis]REG82872.1 hypothetical protein DFP81_10745 [Marinomonas pollencensis]